MSEVDENLCASCGTANGEFNTACRSCGETLPAWATPPGPRRIERLGRYQVTGMLGQGGMGVVYSALDPELDRKVAVKVVRSPDGASRARLLREAQAMARLRHPNLVSVHDVGTVGDEVFVAMELVEGETLRQWLQRERRGWQEVLGVFVAAGRGLAAAHDAGIVHRDFKPDNVLLSAGLDVRVADFGLARAAGEPSDGTPSSSPLTEPLTQTGAVLGTPAYMAPEQRQGLPASAAADQYSFALALAEALAGERPRPGAPPVPPGTGAPAWLVRATTRALAEAPGDRFPSMAALLEELGRDRARPKRLAMAGLLVGGALAAGIALPRAVEEPVCAAAAEPAGVIWTAEARARIRSAFVASRVPYAADAFARLDGELAGWLERWGAARTDACAATHERGEQSAQLLDLRMECLGRQLERTRALVDVLDDADAATVEGAVRAATSLPPASECADRARLTARTPRPVDSGLDALERRLDAAAALESAGRWKVALDAAAPLVDEARALAYPPVLAEALLLAGRLRLRTDDLAGAEELLYRAAEAAAGARDDVLTARALLLSVACVGSKLRKDEPGRALLHAAATAVQRAGAPAELRAELARVTGNLHLDHDRLAEAETALQEALRLEEALSGPMHPATAATLQQLSRVATAQGRWSDAARLTERALAVLTLTLGPDHPTVATTANSVGYSHWMMGDLDGAERYLRRSIATHERAGNGALSDIALPLDNLSGVFIDRGRYADALELARRSLEVREHAFGAEHALVARSMHNVATCLRWLGRLDEAGPLLERSLAIRRAVHGPTDSRVGVGLRGLGELRILQDRLDEAETALLASLAIAEKKGPEHSEVAAVQVALATLHQRRDDCPRAVAAARRALQIVLKDGPDNPDATYPLVVIGSCGSGPQALADLERAVALATAKSIDPIQVANAKLALARALWKRGERDRAARLGEEARDTFAAAGPPARRELAEALDWQRRAGVRR